MNVMKTTYKNISLLQKGYPTPFWIAYSNSRIGKHKPASFTRTGSIIYTANSSIELNMDCILNLTQMHFTKCLLWTQLMIAGMPDQREGNYIQAHVALLTRPNKAAAPGWQGHNWTLRKNQDIDTISKFEMGLITSEATKTARLAENEALNR